MRILGVGFGRGQTLRTAQFLHRKDFQLERSQHDRLWNHIHMSDIRRREEGLVFGQSFCDI